MARAIRSFRSLSSGVFSTIGTTKVSSYLCTQHEKKKHKTPSVTHHPVLSDTVLTSLSQEVCQNIRKPNQWNTFCLSSIRLKTATSFIKNVFLGDRENGMWTSHVQYLLPAMFIYNIYHLLECYFLTWAPWPKSFSNRFIWTHQTGGDGSTRA